MDGAGEFELLFLEYLDSLACALAHHDRFGPLREYLTGLLLPGERKSVEPMAARIAPEHLGSAHQRLHHFVAQSEWSHEALLAAVQRWVLPRITALEPVVCWAIEDTEFAKKGQYSVGVARQPGITPSRQQNCQLAVSLSAVTAKAGLPVAYRLFLPKDWADEPGLRVRAGIPATIAYQTRPEIGLQLIDQALGSGMTSAPISADALYGSNAAFRAALRRRGLRYAVAVADTTQVCISEAGLAAAARQPDDQPGTGAWVGASGIAALGLRQLARAIPAHGFRCAKWRESGGECSSRFARLRVQAVSDGQAEAEEEWLLIEWPAGESQPTRYWLSTLPASVSCAELVQTAKWSARVRQDFARLKQELGLGHYEGRGWRGFHHHASLCIAAYGFLLAIQAPATGAAFIKSPPLSEDYRPRGAPLRPTGSFLQRLTRR